MVAEEFESNLVRVNVCVSRILDWTFREGSGFL